MRYKWPWNNAKLDFNKNKSYLSPISALSNGVCVTNIEWSRADNLLEYVLFQKVFIEVQMSLACNIVVQQDSFTPIIQYLTLNIVI